MATKSLAAWISARAASQRCGLPEKRIALAAKMGFLDARKPPEGVGGQVKYSLASVEALAEAMITPAKPSALRDTMLAAAETAIRELRELDAEEDDLDDDGV